MRVSTVVLALCCLVAGYALAGTRVSAFEEVLQVRHFPSGINVGTHVILQFPSDPKLVDCAITRIDAGWVRCGPAQESFGPPTQQDETWYDIAHVVGMTKRDMQR